MEPYDFAAVLRRHYLALSPTASEEEVSDAVSGMLAFDAKNMGAKCKELRERGYTIEMICGYVSRSESVVRRYLNPKENSHQLAYHKEWKRKQRLYKKIVEIIRSAVTDFLASL